jgi:hypothetical protein
VDISEDGESMTWRTKICLLLLPVSLTFICDQWQIEFPQVWQFPMPLWLISLFIVFILTAPRWYDAPIVFRRVADQITYGVIISFVVMLLITYAVEIMSP